MAWLKKKFQDAMEKLDKDEKQLKPQPLTEGGISGSGAAGGAGSGDKGNNNYNKLDDTCLLGDATTSEADDISEHETDRSEATPNVETLPEVSDSDRESPMKRSEKSWDSDRESVKKSGGGKSDSDRETGKKSSKSSPEAEKKAEKKKKVKTHRRVSSASALSALGGFIKKGHKRERSDSGIVIDKSESKLEPKPKPDQRADDATTIQAFDDSSSLLTERKKDVEKKERKEIAQLFRAESPSKVAYADTNPFRTGHSPIPTGDEKEFTNMSFVTEGEEKDDDTITQNKDDIKNRVRDHLKQWQMHSSSIEQTYDLAALMIEKRKADMMLAITELANELKTQLQNRYTTETQDTKTAVGKLQELKQSVDEGEHCNIQLSDIPRKPISEPYEMTYDKDMDLKESLVPIFGQIEIKPISQLFGAPRDVKATPLQKQQRKCVANTLGLLDKIEYRGSFTTKTTKDVRECGITDLTMTNDNEIIVVDRHNKLVKVFDYKGTLLRFIGRHSLKQPSRATVLPWSNQILVSDNATQTVNLYHSSGSILSAFATDLKFPIDHCIVGDNQVAVIDFEPKEVAIYTFDQYGGHSKTKTFPVLTDCPAYVTATPNGNIVISDWSCNKMKVFDCDGELIKQVSKAGTGQAEFKKPQGVTADCYGNLFVMEQTNHRIQVFDSYGEYVHKYDRSCHEFGVPMCMSVTTDGHFILCEYQGNVKLFKYMDVPNLGLFNYEAPPPRPTIPAPSNAIWPTSPSASDESESMF